MATRLKPQTVPISRMIGRVRTIRPHRARDEDLDFFLAMRRESLRVAGRYVDQLLGRRS